MSSWIWNAAPRRKPKQVERSRSLAAARADQRADPAGWIVVYQHVFLRTIRGSRPRSASNGVVAPPAELDRLALDRLQHHVLDLLEDPVGERRPERRVFSVSEPMLKRVHRVADVDGERDAVLGVQRRPAAPLALPSSMSSWTRKALCSSSSATAEGSACSIGPPKARQVAMHSAGRSPLPSWDSWPEIRS